MMFVYETSKDTKHFIAFKQTIARVIRILFAFVVNALHHSKTFSGWLLPVEVPDN